jgi:GTP-binding protein
MGMIVTEEKKRGILPVKKRDLICLLNKTEGALQSNRVLDSISEALALGLGEPIPISSSHGDGIPDLAVALMAAADERGIVYSAEDPRSARRRTGPSPVDLDNTSSVEGMSVFPELGPEIDVRERIIQLAIMGRPNVGKSTLLNAFVDEERVITGPTPGLTRCVN